MAPAPQARSRNTDSYDVIIVGSGVAGLFAALKIAPFARACILSKDDLHSSNTWLAQGGIAAALGRDDNPRLHAEDTLAAGAGLCRREAVEVLTAEGPLRIKDLLEIGLPFDRREVSQEHDKEAGADLELGREGAHGQNRIVHAGGDSTGRLLSNILIAKIGTLQNLTVRENTFVCGLSISENRVQGVILPGGETLRARATILATGGCSAVYARTTNHPALTGDGIAMAYAAGASIADMEFVQFHPTVFYDPEEQTPFLVSEAVRGEGALLRDKHGHCFMDQYCEQAELGPRDIVARAIAEQMAATGSPCVYLDITHREAAFLQQRFPTIYRLAREKGYDMARQWLPVSPAAHYTMGGIRTGLFGETDLEGLYACGEVSCSGVHGANRLASNSLLEGLVFAERVAGHLEKNLPCRTQTKVETGGARGEYSRVTLTSRQVAEARKKLGKVMLDGAGITRSPSSLEKARDYLQEQAPPPAWIPPDRPGWELKNLFLVALLIVKGALQRTESRGSHYRTDYPQADPSWLRSIVRRENPGGS